MRWPSRSSRNGRLLLGASAPNRLRHSVLSSLTLIVLSVASRASTVASRALSSPRRGGPAVIVLAATPIIVLQPESVVRDLHRSSGPRSPVECLRFLLGARAPIVR